MAITTSGQVMRTDLGWYVLDFEGEPSRSLEERQRHTSVLKDVAGMLRSLYYASQFAVGERAETEPELLQPSPKPGKTATGPRSSAGTGLQGHRGYAAAGTR